MSGWVLVVVVLGAVFLALPAAARIAFEELLPGERPPRDRHMTFAGKLVDVLTVTGFMLTFSYLSVGLIFGSLASEPSVCEQLLTCEPQDGVDANVGLTFLFGSVLSGLWNAFHVAYLRRRQGWPVYAAWLQGPVGSWAIVWGFSNREVVVNAAGILAVVVALSIFVRRAPLRVTGEAPDNATTADT